jgi:anti-sigma factor RsiW
MNMKSINRSVFVGKSANENIAQSFGRCWMLVGTKKKTRGSMRALRRRMPSLAHSFLINELIASTELVSKIAESRDYELRRRARIWVRSRRAKVLVVDQASRGSAPHTIARSYTPSRYARRRLGGTDAMHRG